eukprot:TRINITY_DN2162_c0_g1_i1.p1 TRINITY_DN2162_c0_g1~~TRINITY_DN2162_c0_g1_i1.p1  ORF type:complete len:284 (+),score=48.42 TRINITY_DN2162_c0_g1_i1:210-1061(+)
MSRIVIVALALAATVSGLTCDPQDPILDCHGLVALRDHTGLNEWDAHDGASFCTWPGVECNPAGHVVTLDLQSRHLTGSLPHCGDVEAPHCHDLDDLHALEHLILGSNRISGAIPETLRDLTQLKTLSFSRNAFTGTIPDWMGDLTHLQHLQFNENDLEGTLPERISELTNLEQFGCSQNRFSGTIPEIFGKMSKLTDLYMDLNQFDGWFGRQNWDNLTICDLFPGSPVSRGVLNDCDLGNNPLVCPLPECFANCNIRPTVQPGGSTGVCDSEEDFDPANVPN